MDKVLIDNKSIRSVALEYGLARGMLESYMLYFLEMMNFLESPMVRYR